MEKITSNVCVETKHLIESIAKELKITQSEAIRIIIVEALSDDKLMQKIIESVDNEAIDVHFDLEGIYVEK